MLEEFVAYVVAEGVVDLFEAVEVDHEKGGSGTGALGVEEGCDEALLEEPAVGETGELVVEGVPLVAGNLLLEHNEEHADGDEELLHAPDLGGEVGVLGMIGNPGMQEEDESPQDKAADDSVLAEAFAGKPELEDDCGGEIEKEEAEVGGIAIEVVGDGEPHGYPGKDLAYDEAPSLA